MAICEALSDVKAPKPSIRTDDFAPESHGLLAPGSIFYVKGWTRSYCAWVVLLCAHERPDFLATWPLECKQHLGGNIGRVVLAEVLLHDPRNDCVRGR